MNAPVLDALLAAQSPAATRAPAAGGLGPAPDPMLFLETLSGAAGRGAPSNAGAGSGALPDRLFAALEREPSPRYGLPEPDALAAAKGAHALHPALNQIVASLVGARDRSALLSGNAAAAAPAPATPASAEGRSPVPLPAMPIDVLRGLGMAPAAASAEARPPAEPGVGELPQAAPSAEASRGTESVPRGPAAPDPTALPATRPVFDPLESGAAQRAQLRPAGPAAAAVPNPVPAEGPDPRSVAPAPADATLPAESSSEASARLANAATRLVAPALAPGERGVAEREPRRAVVGARPASEPVDDRSSRVAPSAEAPVRGPVSSPGSTAFTAGEDLHGSQPNDPRASQPNHPFASALGDPRAAVPGELRAAPSETFDPSVRGAVEPGSDPASRTPVPASRVPETLAAQVERLSQGDGGTARIRLHPQSLGELQLQVRVRGQSVDVTVIAREVAAQALVAGGREQLADALSGRDLRMESFDVQGQDRDASDREPRGGHADRGDPNARGERNGRNPNERPGHEGQVGADPKGLLAADRSGAHHESDAVNAGDRVHWVI